MPAKEIRIHGRGGQGTVLSSKILATAFAYEGLHVASFPMFGFERRGMPVKAFTRFDKQPIREKTQIYTPDCVMVIDPTLLHLTTLYSGLKPGGVVIVNSANLYKKRPYSNESKTGVINATQVALSEIGRDIPNTCLIGALAATTGWVSLEAVIVGMSQYLDGEKLSKNIRNAERGYKEVEVLSWE